MKSMSLIYRCCLPLLLISMGLASSNLKAQVDLNNKAQLTAAFIYQITKFTQWPENLSTKNSASFSICVLGQAEGPLYQYLSELETKSTHGHKIELVQLNNKQQLLDGSDSHCKVLYATDKHWESLSKEEMAQLSQSTLLIGNSKLFLQQGGMMSLLIVDNKMKIFINSANIANTPIKLESRLKALVKSV